MVTAARSVPGISKEGVEPASWTSGRARSPAPSRATDSANAASPSFGAVPSVFACADRDLFGLYHPAAKPGHALGAVLCNPLGYEAMCAHRTYRHLAERLADAGMPALRFDYDGTGDSAGDLDDPGRLAAWVRSVHAAIDHLRAVSGVARVALFGVRFGAALATLAASTRPDVDALVLWAPVVTGRSHLRELRAFRLIQGERRGSGAATRDDGGEEIAGYSFSRETLTDISGVDLAAWSGAPARRALVIPRDDLPGAEARLVANLRARGCDATLESRAGYADMMRDPTDVVVPSSTIDDVVAWIAGAAEPASAAAPRAVLRATLTTHARGGRGPLQESAVAFDRARLFGILTHPSPGARPDRPAVVLLNVGANHHVGPNRMYVTFARQLADMGCPTLRFDVGGIGESRPAPGAPENRLYAMASVAETRLAMDAVERECGPRRFVLVGLCSGAYLAFHAAVADARVAGQVLLNPQTFEWKDGDSLAVSVRKNLQSTRYYRRAFADRRVWMRTLRGDVNVRAVASVLRERIEDRLRDEVRTVVARLRGRREPRTEVALRFEGLCERGVETLFVFSFDDGGLDMIDGHFGAGARRMRRRKNFVVEVLDGADHTFTPSASQLALRDLVTAYVTRRFP